jgi:oxaloacetate decarboxylase alpha subunit
MAGLLRPYVAEELVTRLKETCAIPIAMQCHATTGMSTATYIKAAEAGIDLLDTAISSMSMTYGHSPTESLVAILEGTPRDTGLDLKLLEEIAAYFRQVRKKYARFEGSLRGVDSRILVAQVPGGMLTNMESQLREQGATDRLDEVLEEIPRVREDLGFIPLVTPTSQIVGSQAVLNVLLGERYKSITNETAGVLKGAYGTTPAPVNKELQARVLADGEEPITCRPADELSPELDRLAAELEGIATERRLDLAQDQIDDVLIYAMFPQVGLKFLGHRNDPSAFEPPPWELDAKEKAAAEAAAQPPAGAPAGGPERYRVDVDGRSYSVTVSPEGSLEAVTAVPATGEAAAAPTPAAAAHMVESPLAGNIVRINVKPGDKAGMGDVLLVLEAMKMETEVRATIAGTVVEVRVREGDAVALGAPLLSLG